MKIFLSSLSGVLEILLLMVLGAFLTEKGWFGEQTSKRLARIVTQIALPADMIVTISQKFTAATLLKTLPDLFFPIISMLLLMILSFGVSKLIHVPISHRGTFQSLFFNSNTIFIGLPVDMALFGVKSLPYLLVYYMANTTIFWTIGTYLIQKDGNTAVRFDWKQTLRKVFSPPLLGFLFGIFMVLVDLRLPNFLMADLAYLGNLTIPGAMIFIGITIAHIGIKQLKMDRDVFAIFIGRFLIAPLLMTALIIWTPLPMMMKKVFILQAAMPAMTNAPVVAKLYGADDRFAARVVAETTLASIIVIPVVMTCLQ